MAMTGRQTRYSWMYEKLATSAYSPSRLCRVAVTHQSSDLVPLWKLWSTEVQDAEQELTVGRLVPWTRHAELVGRLRLGQS